MANDQEQDEIPATVLDEWYRLHDGRKDGEPAGIGIRARDKLIRRLIEKVRRLRRCGGGSAT
jgi:hypothetical protein